MKGQEMYISTKGWTSSKCLDGKKLFESIIYKPNDTLKYVIMVYEGDSLWNQHRDSIRYNLKKFEFETYDNAYYGRCTVFTPSEERVKQGIKGIDLILEKTAKIFIHTQGMFLSYPEKTMKYLGETIRLELPETNLELARTYTWDVKHEVHELVEFNGNDCIIEKQYSKDLCTDKIIQRESLEKVGCTTPFGIDKNKICVNESDANKALKIYDEGMNMWRWNGSDLLTTECLNPCSVLTFSTKDIKSEKTSAPHRALVHINFEEQIKVTTDYHTYTALSLIAEIGGYVGLFLGISVNQVIDLLGFLVVKIRRLHTLLKIWIQS